MQNNKKMGLIVALLVIIHLQMFVQDLVGII